MKPVKTASTFGSLDGTESQIRCVENNFLFHVKLCNFVSLKNFSKAIFVCVKSKAELFIFVIFFVFWINSYSCARDGLIAQNRFGHARAQKLQLHDEFWSNFRRNRGIRDVWLSNSVFSAFFRLFDRNLALKAYFNCILYHSHVIL